MPETPRSELAAIYLYRDPSGVPAGFNLLAFFDFGAFNCPLEVEGFELWEVEPLSAPPKIIISRGIGAVPVWFVPADVISQAMADGELKIGELAGLEGLLVGTAEQFSETHHPEPFPQSLPPPCTDGTSEITLAGATRTITLSTSEVIGPSPTPFRFPFLSSGERVITGGTGESSGIIGSGTGRAVILPNGRSAAHLSRSVS